MRLCRTRPPHGAVSEHRFLSYSIDSDSHHLFLFKKWETFFSTLLGSVAGALQIELPDVGVTGKRDLFHVAMGMPRRNAIKTPKDRPQGR